MKVLVVLLVCVALASAERSKIRDRNLRKRAADDPFTLSFGPSGGSSGGCTNKLTNCDYYSAGCTNKLTNCDSYGRGVCTNSDYTSWVQDNCCAFCNGGAPSSGGDGGFSLSFGTSAPAVVSGGGSCMDAIPNCASYTTSVCSDSNYAQWVTKNCPKFCNKCSSSSGGSYPVPNPGGSTSTGGGSCVDKLPNCASYGQSTCTSPDYTQWVKDNCPKYCNQCGGSSSMGTGTMPQTASCMDKLADCSAYSQSACTSYPDWAKVNCPRFCNFCSSGSSTSTGGSTGGCTDVTSNCAMLKTVSHICSDSGSRVFAQQNCAMTCGMCSGGGSTMTGPSLPMPSTGGSCADAKSDCASYGQSVCTNPDYTSWAKTNCPKFCNLCSSSSSGGGMPQPVPGGSTGGGSGGSFSGSSSGCVYQGKLHQQGETWKDACKYQCTCDDGSSGKYTCRALCVTWNLPSQCSMNPPAPGKCCQTPNCPSGFTLQYPPNYVEN